MSTAAAIVDVCLAMLGLVVVALSALQPRQPKFSSRNSQDLHIGVIPSWGMKMANPRNREGRQMDTVIYSVPDMSCSHCETAVKREISALPGVDSVVVDLATKRVEVAGTALDDAAIREAIEEAGYEAA
jgi:copper chaperone